MTLLALEPPFAAFTPAGPFCVGLGTLLCADLSDGIPALARALSAHAISPWAPLVLRLPDHRVPARTLAEFEPVPGTWAFLYPGDFEHLSPEQRVIAAVRHRLVPSDASIARWVELRLGLSPAGGLLLDCLHSGGRPHPPRTLSRRLRALGPFEARDWRGLAELARIVAGVGHGLTLEAQAYLAGLDPRTLRRWLRLATDLRWTEVSRRAGWEWLLESALRRSGCLGRQPSHRVPGLRSGVVRRVGPGRAAVGSG
ncbi:MAG: hypothetical protein SF070_11165 [Gemmatimonadota bacterium]|nr:hypothetical protein [Gemmatimonadota bacterium]